MINRFYTPGHIIQRKIELKDEWGGSTEEWTDLIIIEGKLWQLSGDKRLSADKETIFADYKFACNLTDIKEADRYIDPDNRIFKIKAIAERKRPGGTGHLELELEHTGEKLEEVEKQTAYFISPAFAAM